MWYEERSPLSAAAFAHEVENAISRIKEAPTRYPPAEHGTRRFVLSGFRSTSSIVLAPAKSSLLRWLITSGAQTTGANDRRVRSGRDSVVREWKEKP